MKGSLGQPLRGPAGGDPAACVEISAERGDSVIDWTAWCEERGIRFLRLAWVDSGGVLRAEAVNARGLASIGTEGLPLASAIQVALPLDDLAEDEELNAVGQVWLVPDPESVQVIPWEPGHARAMGFFVDAGGASWTHCPRGALRRAVETLAARGFALQAAFEHEFMLLRRANPGFEHFEDASYASARSLDHAAPLLDRMAESMESQGVLVRTFLKEAGRSQFEFSTQHGPVLQAADHFVIARETIAAEADRDGLIGTVLPLVYPLEAGNGWHLHFSLWRGEDNLTGRGTELGPEARAFVAGVFDHLPALLALTVPSPNSFHRIRPGAWCGSYRAWGYDHKEAPLRVPSERHGAPTNVELKSSDATANPYLSLVGVIAAGLDGLDRDLELPEPIDRDPALFSEEQRQSAGIEALPATLSEALDALDADPVLLAALGEPLARSYRAVKRAEIASVEGLSLDEQIAQLVEVY